MAKDTNRVLEDTIGAFKRLKEQVKQYKDELATLTVGTDEWNKKAKELANAQKQVDVINKAAKGNLAAYNAEEVKSINDIKQRIKELNAERNAMYMNSKEYKKATAELKVLNDQLREAGTSAGDWRANVGNYTESIKNAFGELGTAATALGGSVGGLNAGLLKLAANPVGAVVAALAGGIKFLSEGIKSSEENTNKWNEAMIPLKTVIVMIQKEAQKAAEKFTEWVKSLRQNETAIKVVEGALKVLLTMFEMTKARIQGVISALGDVKDGFKNAFDKAKNWVNGVAERFPNLTAKARELGGVIKEKIGKAMTDLIGLHDKVANSWIGKILGLQTSKKIKEIGETVEEEAEEIKDEFKETEEEVTKVVKASNKLAETLRGLGHQAAKLRGEIEGLSAAYAEALEEEDYDEAQRILDEKTEKEKELARTQMAIASAQLNVIRQQNALAKSGTADLNAEAQAMDALTEASYGLARADREAAQQQKKLNRAKQAKEDKEAADALKKAVEELNIELNKYIQQYNTAIALEKPEKPEGGDLTEESANSYYDQVKENARIEYEAYAEMTEMKIAKLEEWLEAQRAAGVEETKLAQQVIELEKLKGEAAAGYPQQYKKMIDTQNDADKNRAKTLKALQRSEIQGYANLFDSVSGMFEQNTFAYKATATAKALINTYLAATSALAETPGGAIAKGVAMAATLAAGIAQVMAIWKTNPKGETSVPNATTATPAVAEPVMVESQPFTYTRTAQTFEEEEQLNQPLFVSVTDINNVQNRVKVVEEESSF